MDYPTILQPTDIEHLLLPSGQRVEIPKAKPVFSLWLGKPLFDTYNGKCVLEHAGKPLFAELVILSCLKAAGWEGVWVDSYRRRFLTDFSEKVSLPAAQFELFDDIQKRAMARGGCFDIFCWRKNEVLFVEAKRLGKDAIRPTQKRWVEAALDWGLPTESLLVVEWRCEH
ncbi:MAG TPA: hypothetical protein VK737_00680 [Opitutales bacterium]|nr:hypothetical protein [Opitutales bacterium]